MARVTTNKQTVDITSVNAEVTCLECGSTFNVQMKRPKFMSNCRCGNGTFHFTVRGGKGYVEVLVQFQGKGFKTVTIEPNSLEVDE